MKQVPTVIAIVATLLAHAISATPAPGQIYRLPRADERPADFFGAAVSIDGDRVLVGATGANSCGQNSGASYLYARDESTGHWKLEAELTPSDCVEFGHFGRSLGLSGGVAAVAAYQPAFSTIARNAVYVFEQDTSGTWRQTAKLIGDTSREEGPFASSVDVDDGRILVTTAGDLTRGRFPGAAYVYEKNEAGVWAASTRLIGSGPTAQGVFGGAGDIDGDRIVVAASTYFREKEGSAYVFEYDRTAKTWQETAQLVGFEDFFISASIAENRILIGESKAGREDEGRATVFERDADGAWRRVARLSPNSPFKLGAFGSAVAIEADRALVVGFDEQLQFQFNIDRVVFVFERDKADGSWRQRHVIDIGDVYFGASLDIDRQVAVIGRASEDAPGAVFVIQLH